LFFAASSPPVGRASFEADAWRLAAFLAAIQAKTWSASLMASRNTLAEIIHPRFAMRQASYVWLWRDSEVCEG
jgi:hypothetical protein